MEQGGARELLRHARELLLRQIARSLLHDHRQLGSLLLPQHIDTTVVVHCLLQHSCNVPDIARALVVLAPRCHFKGMPVTQMAHEIRSPVMTGPLRRAHAQQAYVLHNLRECVVYWYSI